MCDRFPLRRITNFQFSPVVVVPFYSSSLVLLSTRQSCDRDFFRICDVAIGVALAQYDSSLNKRYSPPRKSIYILFFKEPNSSFRPVSIEKLTSLFILFLIFLHSIPRSRANWNSNDTPLFLFRHLKTVIKTICEKIIATIIWSFHSQVGLDRNINLETENFIRKIFRMNESSGLQICDEEAKDWKIRKNRDVCNVAGKIWTSAGNFQCLILLDPEIEIYRHFIVIFPGCWTRQCPLFPGFVPEQATLSCVRVLK